jgi:hypothetical protein
MSLDWKGIREKVAIVAITTVVLAGLGIFANWACPGGLVHALGGASSKDSDVSLQTMRELQAQIADMKKNTDGNVGLQTMRELQSQIAEIKRKTDNICFQDQLGRPVLYPCAGPQ